MPCHAQITGTTSLLTIPVADMPPDGTMTLGISYVDKEYSDYLGGKVDYRPLYVSMVFLPFVELGVRFNRPMGLDDVSRIGDRMTILRIQALSETAKRPAVVFGAQDLFTTVDRAYFHALYLVVSKHIQLLLPVGLHAGYGSDAVDARGYEFAGPFGGMSLSLLPYLELIGEYDAERVNIGARVTIVDHFQVMAGLEGLDTPIVGASANVRL